ncbi:hypothetical protein OROGR_021498 [Orobanche gracilis]
MAHIALSQRKMSFNLKDPRAIGAAVRHIWASESVPRIYNRLLHNGPDTIDELLDRHLVKNDDAKHLDDYEKELVTRRRLTSARREAMSLYRDIIRATRFFMWPDSRGVPWRDVLRENARKEFDDARFEKDPEVITRLLIGGRDAVHAALDKLVEKQKQQVENERNQSHGL